MCLRFARQGIGSIYVAHPYIPIAPIAFCLYLNLHTPDSLCCTSHCRQTYHTHLCSPSLSTKLFIAVPTHTTVTLQCTLLILCSNSFWDTPWYSCQYRLKTLFSVVHILVPMQCTLLSFCSDYLCNTLRHECQSCRKTRFSTVHIPVIMLCPSQLLWSALLFLCSAYVCPS
jgi:uncharacterized protein (DUF486 family)